MIIRLLDVLNQRTSKQVHLFRAENPRPELTDKYPPRHPIVKTVIRLQEQGKLKEGLHGRIINSYLAKYHIPQILHEKIKSLSLSSLLNIKTSKSLAF